MGTILREMIELKRSFSEAGKPTNDVEAKLDGILDAVELVRSQVEEQGAKIEGLQSTLRGREEVRGSTGSLQRRWSKKDKKNT